MLNRAEFNQLKSPLLSHLARTMYIFYLHPQAPKGAMQVDPIALTADLVSQSAIMPCSPNLEMIEGALSELEQEQLIARVMPNSPWQGALIIFPLFAQELLEVPHAPFCMYPNWQPGPSFRNAALLAGLIDYSYQEQELAGFINFWLERAARHNQYGWERLFIQRLLKLRSADNFTQAAARYQRRRMPSSNGLGPNTLKSSQAQNGVLPATVKKRSVNNDSRVRSNHYTTTQNATQTLTLRGVLSAQPQYEITAAGYTDAVSKERMLKDNMAGYATYQSAASTGNYLPRFDGQVASASSQDTALRQESAPAPVSQEGTLAKSSAPESHRNPLASSGGFDLEYLKELDAAFATNVNSEFIKQAEAKMAAPSAAPSAAPNAAPSAAPHAGDSSQPSAAQTQLAAQSTPENKETQAAVKPKPEASANKSSAPRKGNSGGYQRMDFSKLGINAELS